MRIDIKQTYKDKLKEWNKIKEGSYFYCRGNRSADEEDIDIIEFPEYAYIGVTISKNTEDNDDEYWNCDDVWNLLEIDESDDWAAQKKTMLMHDIFVVIDIDDYPEFLL